MRTAILVAILGLGCATASAQTMIINPGQPPTLIQPVGPGMYIVTPPPQQPQWIVPPVQPAPAAPQFPQPGRQFQMPSAPCMPTPYGVRC